MCLKMGNIKSEYFYEFLPFNESIHTTGVVYSVGKKSERIEARQILTTQNGDGSKHLLDLQGQMGETMRVLHIPTHWVDNIYSDEQKIVVMWSGGDTGAMVNYQLEITKDKS